MRIRVAGTSTWTTYKTSPPTTSKKVSELYTNTQYEYQVQTLCSGTETSSSPFSTSYFFTTSNFCTAPTGLSSTNITSNSATLNWNLAANATKYQLRIRPVGTSSWTNYNKPGSSTFINISGLAALTNYEWQIRSKCVSGSADNSNYSPLQNFTTLSNRLPQSDVQVVNPVLAVYPNPSAGKFTVELNDGAKGKTILIISNLVGKEVYRFETENEFRNFYKEVDLSALSDGVYFLHLSFNDINYVRAIVKQ